MKSITRSWRGLRLVVGATATIASVALGASPAASAAATVPSPATEAGASTQSQITDRVRTELTNHDVPGISVAVMRHGDFGYRRGFGYADLGDHVPMKPYHAGRLASISKSVGGVLLMSMVERGEIRLDEPTRSYVPAMPEHTATPSANWRATAAAYGGTTTPTGTSPPGRTTPRWRPPGSSGTTRSDAPPANTSTAPTATPSWARHWKPPVAETPSPTWYVIASPSRTTSGACCRRTVRTAASREWRSTTTTTARPYLTS